MMESNINKKPSKAILAIVLTLVALAIAAVIAMLVLHEDSRAPGSSDNTSAAQSGLSATITFSDNGFEPSMLTVKKGTVVTVVNNASSPVQFSSGEHPTHRENPEINMERLRPGEKGTFTATTKGSHTYHDHIDESKIGTLIVTD